MNTLFLPLIKSESLEILLRGTVKLLPVSVFISCLLAVELLYSAVPFHTISYWFSAVVMIAFIRYFHCRYLLDQKILDSTSRNQIFLFLGLTFMMGLAWAAAWFMFLPHVTKGQEFVILFALVSIAAGGVASLSVFYPAFCVYILPMLFPVSVYFFVQSTFDSILWAFIVMLFMILLLFIARLNADLLIRNVRLTKEKDSLITALKNSNDNLVQSLKEIEVLSNTDALTGIYNRRFFDKSLKKELDRVRRNKYPVNLILFDIDNFKLINDLQGHPQGDLFLQNFAALLSDHFKRANDLVFRIGGDEFAAIMVNMSHDDAVEYCEYVKEVFDKQNQYKNISLSIGIISFDETYDHNYQMLVSEADKVLYIAKEHGKNQIVTKVLSSSLDVSATQ